MNPGALPLDYDQYVQDTRASTRALQEVYQARTAQVSAQAGLSVDDQGEVEEATDSAKGADSAAGAKGQRKSGRRRGRQPGLRDRLRDAIS